MIRIVALSTLLSIPPISAANDIGYDFTFWMDTFIISYASIECGHDAENGIAEYKVVLPQPITEPINVVPLKGLIPPNEEMYCWGFFSIADKNPPNTTMGGPYYAGRVVKVWSMADLANPMPPIIINN